MGGGAAYNLNYMAREGLPEKMQEDLKERGSHPADIWGKSIPGRRYRCKGPEAGAYLVCLKKRQEAVCLREREQVRGQE